MKKNKILIISLCFTMLVGCKSTPEIYEKVNGALLFYPTKDIMSFYDKEDPEFDSIYTPNNRDDRGTWQLSSSYRTYENDNLISNHMVLSINRNTQQITGTYYTSSYLEDGSEQRDEYHLTYDEDGYHLIDEVQDENLRNQILNYKFMFQYLNLSMDDLNTFRITDKKYNYSTGSYGLYYAFDNQQYLKQIQEHYGIKETIENAKLILESDGSGPEMRIELNNKGEAQIQEQISFTESDEFKDLEEYYSPIDNTSLMQYFTKIYPTQDMDNFLTKKAYEFDRNRGVYNFAFSMYEDDEVVKEVDYEINKETQQQSGTYKKKDTIVDIAYKDNAFYDSTGIHKEVNDFNFLFQKIAIDALPEPVYNSSKANNEFSATYTLTSEHELLQQLKTAYPYLQIADELELIFSYDLETNLAYGFGDKMLELNYMGTNGKQMQVIETIVYNSL